MTFQLPQELPSTTEVWEEELKIEDDILGEERANGGGNRLITTLSDECVIIDPTGPKTSSTVVSDKSNKDAELDTDGTITSAKTSTTSGALAIEDEKIDNNNVQGSKEKEGKTEEEDGARGPQLRPRARTESTMTTNPSGGGRTTRNSNQITSHFRSAGKGSKGKEGNNSGR